MNDGILPWGRLYRLALKAGVTADKFWNLSFRELMALFGDDRPRLTRADLEGLMEMFPDG